VQLKSELKTNKLLEIKGGRQVPMLATPMTVSLITIINVGTNAAYSQITLSSVVLMVMICNVGRPTCYHQHSYGNN